MVNFFINSLYFAGFMFAAFLAIGIGSSVWEKISTRSALRHLGDQPCVASALVLIQRFVREKNAEAALAVISKQPELGKLLEPHLMDWVQALESGSGAFGSDMGRGMHLHSCEDRLIKACDAISKPI